MPSNFFSSFFLKVGKLAMYALPLVAGGVVVYVVFHFMFFLPLDPDSTKNVSFVVKQGDNLQTVSKELEQQEVVRFWWSVYYPGRRKARTLQVGEYSVSPSMTPEEILNTFLEAKIIYRSITIPEGYRLDEIIQQMVNTELVTMEDAVRASQNRNLISQASPTAVTLEGYLFPETYKFTRPISAEDMLKTMINEGRKKVTNKIIEQSMKLQLNYHQVLTLASIIESETAVAEERTLVSSVFHNRMNIGMPLQSDPTVVYGLKLFNQPITKKHLRTQNGYNTYLNVHLPPGPICNPGLDSIIAALYPADTDFLYFVAKGDGTHQFSSNLKDHNRAVNKYIKSRKKEKSKQQ